MDAFTENWGEVFGLFVPPVILVPRVLQQIQEQRTRGVFGHSLLALRAFWALLCTCQKGFTKQVTNLMDLSISKDFYIRPLRVVGVFWYRRPLFAMVALKVNYRDL